MNIKGLAENINLEEDEFLEIGTLFVTTTYADLLKLRQAVDGKDNETVMKMAHSIKGAAVNVGLMEIYELAKRIEMMARHHRLDEAIEAIRMTEERVDMIAEILRNH